MALKQFKNLLKDIEHYHLKNEAGTFDFEYFFEIEREFEGISFKYYIAEEKSHLWIEIYESIDFTDLLSELSEYHEIDGLKITIYCDDLSVRNNEILTLFENDSLESLELINFSRILSNLELSNKRISHLFSLSILDEKDFEGKTLVISIKESFKHRLETFYGVLDTWESLENLFMSSFMSNCHVYVLDQQTPHLLMGNIENLYIASNHKPHIVFPSLILKNIFTLNIEHI